MLNVKAQVITVTGATGNITKSLRKIHQQHTNKAQNQGTRQKSYTEHCTHTSESANVKMRNECWDRILNVPKIVTAEQVAPAYAIETQFVRDVKL